MHNTKTKTPKNIITHDIRNFRQLTDEQTKSLLSLSEKEKDEILLLYNEIVKTYSECLLDHK
jgi:hypothetical protein